MLGGKVLFFFESVKLQQQLWRPNTSLDLIRLRLRIEFNYRHFITGDNCKEMEFAVIELNDLTAIFKLFLLLVEPSFLSAEQFPVNGPIECQQCVSRWQSRQRVPHLSLSLSLHCWL